jgi:hypothetical protein
MGDHKTGQTPFEQELIRRHCLLNWQDKHVETVEASKETPSQAYGYIYKLLMTPLDDGRHRILWLVLAPWAINVAHLSYESAYKIIDDYLQECKKVFDTNADEDIDYYLDYAKSSGLLPLKFETFKRKWPEWGAKL